MRWLEEEVERAVRDQGRVRRATADPVDVLAEGLCDGDDRIRSPVELPLEDLGQPRREPGRDLVEARRSRRPEIANVQHQRGTHHARDRPSRCAREEGRRRRDDHVGAADERRVICVFSALVFTHTRSTRYGFERSSSRMRPRYSDGRTPCGWFGNSATTVTRWPRRARYSANDCMRACVAPISGGKYCDTIRTSRVRDARGTCPPASVGESGRGPAATTLRLRGWACRSSSR